MEHYLFNYWILDNFFIFLVVKSSRRRVKQSNNWTWEGCRFDSSNNFREIRGSASLEATYVLKMNKISIAPNTGNFEDYFYTLWGYYDG